MRYQPSIFNICPKYPVHVLHISAPFGPHCSKHFNTSDLYLYVCQISKTEFCIKRSYNAGIRIWRYPYLRVPLHRGTLVQGHPYVYTHIYIGNPYTRGPLYREVCQRMSKLAVQKACLQDFVQAVKGCQRLSPAPGGCPYIGVSLYKRTHIQVARLPKLMHEAKRLRIRPTPRAAINIITNATTSTINIKPSEL